MEVAKIIPNGGSQAVRLPKSCRFDEEEVFVNKIGNIVMLVPKNEPWKAMLDSLNMFTDDFLANGIEDLPIQERREL